MEETPEDNMPEDLRKFVNMRMDSAFFTQEYKADLAKLITEAHANNNWNPVKRFMWPMIEG